MHMNMKLIHYDRCYYNEHKLIHHSGRHYPLVTRTDRKQQDDYPPPGDTHGHGHYWLVSHTSISFPVSLYEDMFARRLFTQQVKPNLRGEEDACPQEFSWLCTLPAGGWSRDGRGSICKGTILNDVFTPWVLQKWTPASRGLERALLRLKVWTPENDHLP